MTARFSRGQPAPRAVFVLGALLLCASCTSDEGAGASSAPNSAATGATSLQEALVDGEVGDEVTLDVALVTERGGIPYLCDMVMDSDPERCSEPRVRLLDAPLDELDLEYRRDEWSGMVHLVVVLEDESTVSYVRSE